MDAALDEMIDVKCADDYYPALSRLLKIMWECKEKEHFAVYEIGVCRDNGKMHIVCYVPISDTQYMCYVTPDVPERIFFIDNSIPKRVACNAVLKNKDMSIVMVSAEPESSDIVGVPKILYYNK